MRKTNTALPFTQKEIRRLPFIKCGAPKVCPAGMFDRLRAESGNTNVSKKILHMGKSFKQLVVIVHTGI
ncbi:MAG: hypothetical protein OIN90_08225 [Candidatus Methanoperedens sp.]|nr:hypothetical protein [Candidatus Methanoperedens sp.]